MLDRLTTAAALALSVGDLRELTGRDLVAALQPGRALSGSRAFG
jgi:hypothetical protein